MGCTYERHGDHDQIGGAAVRAGTALLARGLQHMDDAYGDAREVYQATLREVFALLPDGTCADCLRLTLTGVIVSMAGVVYPSTRAMVVGRLQEDLLRMAGEPD